MQTIKDFFWLLSRPSENINAIRNTQNAAQINNTLDNAQHPVAVNQNNMASNAPIPGNNGVIYGPNGPNVHQNTSQNSGNIGNNPGNNNVTNTSYRPNMYNSTNNTPNGQYTSQPMHQYSNIPPQGNQYGWGPPYPPPQYQGYHGYYPSFAGLSGRINQQQHSQNQQPVYSEQQVFNSMAISSVPGTAPVSEPLSSQALPPAFNAIEQTVNMMNTDDIDWPQGYQRREQQYDGQKSHKWKTNKWAWRSNDPAARTLQLQEICSLCKSGLVLIKCDVKTHHYTTTRNGSDIMVWEHIGNHDHVRPPGGPLSQLQDDAVDAQILRRSEASAHALRTGDTAAGSVPLGEISSTLANPRASRYQIAQSQERLGLSGGQSRGGLGIIASIANLQEELKKPFIINSSIHGPVFLMFQTSFMKTVLEESIHMWSIDINLEALMQLDMDCTVMSAWIPVLYTWIQHPDTEHNRAHFRHISQSVINYIAAQKIEFHSKYLLHVMDFSAAQRAAHAEEYAEAIISMTPGYKSLTPASQKLEREKYLEQAEEAEQGCDFHFWQSATRIKKNGALIPLANASEFDHLLGTMIAKSTSSERFDSAVQSIQAAFPRIGAWLSWWLRPKVASMIFPARNVTDPAVVAQVPRTGNPAEHSHSLLHHAVGKDQDLIPGIKKLFLHVEELERQFTAIKAGHYNAQPSREYRPVKPKPYDENDGRAPDTEAAIHPKGIRDQNTLNEHAFVSYKWDSPNSCFFDNGMEVWFRAFALWTSSAQTKFLKLLPTGSFLAVLFYHYERRLRTMYKAATPLQVSRNLGLMQGITRDYIFFKWRMYRNSYDYGSAKSWLSRAVNDKITSIEIKKHFGVYHLVTQNCPGGHTQESYASDLPQVMVSLYHHQLELLRASLRESSGTGELHLTDYFSRHIPVQVSEHDDKTLEPLHLLKDIPCATAGCSLHASITDISTLWPQVLNILPDFSADRLYNGNIQRMRFMNSFTIPNSTPSPVTYTLVGRVLHSDDHFTSHIRFGGRAYTYDDMKKAGNLVQTADSGLLERPNVNSVYYVYHRVSSDFKTTRNIEDIRFDYDESMLYNWDKPQSIHSASSEPPPVPPKDFPPVLPKDTPVASGSTLQGRALGVSTLVSEAYLKCGISCSNTKHAYLSLDVLCNLCNTKWHDECVQDTFIVGYDHGLYDSWCCPECVNTEGGHWDQLLLGQYILLPVNMSPTARYYPGLVKRRSFSTQVEVHWHHGNIYNREEDLPEDSYTVLSPQDCLNAYCCDNSIKKLKVGAIKWPIQLVADAHEDMGYTNAAIQLALEDSFHSVKEIICGCLSHPIIDIFTHWINASKKPKKGMKKRMYNQLEKQFDFIELFAFKILPADSSLIEPFIIDLNHHIDNQPISDMTTHFSMLAKILFTMVVIRVYMEATPEDDLQIFWLLYTLRSNTNTPDDVYAAAKSGTIWRQLSDSEMAMGACLMADQDRETLLWSRDYKTSSYPSICGSKILECKVDKTSVLSAVVKAVNGSGTTYNFIKTGDSGMTGGPPFVSCHRSMIDSAPDLPERPIRPLPKERLGTITQPVARVIMSDYFPLAVTPATAPSIAVTENTGPLAVKKGRKRMKRVVEESEKRRSTRNKSSN